MSAIALILLVFLVCLFLIIVASLWYMRFMLEKIFGEKHRDMEAIASSGTIPEHWSRKFTMKMIRLHEAGKPEEVREMQMAAARSYLRKLRRLTAYVKKTNLVENEETRKHMLRMLETVHREWSDKAKDGSVIAGT